MLRSWGAGNAKIHEQQTQVLPQKDSTQGFFQSETKLIKTPDRVGEILRICAFEVLVLTSRPDS